MPLHYAGLESLPVVSYIPVGFDYILYNV